MKNKDQRATKDQRAATVRKKTATTTKTAAAGKKRAKETPVPAKKVVATKPRPRASSRTVAPPPLPPLPPAPPFMDRGKPIPDVYGRDVLRMMARDPEWVFLYWEVTPQRLRQLHSRFANLHTKPWRVKLVDTDNNVTHEAPVFLGACSWYLPAQPRTAYRAELGFMDGAMFVKVLVSNEIKTPANTMSDCADEEWMILRRDLMRMLHLQDEKDLFGPGRPFASVERFRDMAFEESSVLERLARQAGKLGASTNMGAKK